MDVSALISRNGRLIYLRYSVMGIVHDSGIDLGPVKVLILSRKGTRDPLVRLSGCLAVHH